MLAKDIYTFALSHVVDQELYRIFYYDCPPLMKKAHNPITNKVIDFSKTTTAVMRLALFDQLRRKRKMALRLGYLPEKQAQWKIKEDRLKDLVTGKIERSDLLETDVYYHAPQKGVDMKIGVDISSLAFQKHVKRIVLIAGDGDFVPAAKLARRMGIDFILNPMYQNISADLYEHIDGIGIPKRINDSVSRAKRSVRKNEF